MQPIRTAAEITARIKILPVHQPYLYQKLSKKATQLRLLGMSYQQIAKSLNTNKKTAVRACREGGNLMFWSLSIYRLMHPKERYVWAQIRILHETYKAILVNNGTKTWIPKSQIYGIKLRNNFFQIYVKESTVG